MLAPLQLSIVWALYKIATFVKYVLLFEERRLESEGTSDNAIEEFNTESFIGPSLWVEKKQLVRDDLGIEAFPLKVNLSQLKRACR